MSIALSGSNRILFELPRGGDFEATAQANGFESVAAPGWVAAPVLRTATGHPWDEAHRAVRDPAAVGFETIAEPVYAEPDFMQSFPFPRPDAGGLESFAGSPCEDLAPNDAWPIGTPEFGWHLDASHSRLLAARTRAGDPGDGRRVRIAHLDTGYDPAHATVPLHFLSSLQRNFADGDAADATDPGRHFPGNQPGHGTATLALLAGRRIAIPGSGFDDYLGGAPFAEIVPVRIANSVIHFTTSAMAKGIEYAVEAGCHIASISMGGVPARSWAAAVNCAYESGVAIFAAAGNRFGPASPRSIVWPARFNRVVAVCGVTSDGTPYSKSGLHSLMQGCFGPTSKMGTSLAAYTPNAPWAMMGCSGTVGFGGGTSSATPQAAAAAALWLQAAATPTGVAPWQRVEAVRAALFSSADRSHAEVDTYFGRGVLRADAALDRPFRANLPITPPDELSFPWLRRADQFESVPSGFERMHEVEALQVYVQSLRLQELAGGADPETNRLTRTEVRPVLSAMEKSPMISNTLRARLKAALTSASF